MLNRRISKFKARKTTVLGTTFDSSREARRFLVLKDMEKRGLIRDLRRQVSFILAPSVVIKGRKKPALKYICDFTYYENDSFVVEDSKGLITPTYSIKRHLMKSVHGIDIKET